MPIYLVSACASGEEFFSAFRRYADRNGVVFVPIAQPLAPGRKGRFALTLKDGGVMVEGVAEVVSSARTPSVLYGRVGMTLKFLEPDDPSRITLGELEKARLAMKPAPPGIAPRAADVPAEPRPTPPAPGGRVDAVNALAECVVIGDLSMLSGEDFPARMGNPKFVVPSIPPAPTRAKSSSVPPPTPPLKPPTGGNPIVVAPRAPRASTPAGAVPAVGKETVMGMQPIDRLPAPTASPTLVARQPTPAAPMPVVARPPTPPVPLSIAPPPPLIAPAPPVTRLVEAAEEPTDLTNVPQVDDAVPIAVPAHDETPEKPEKRSRKTVIGIAVVPSGVHVLPAAPAPRLDEDELRDTSVMTALDDPSEPAMITRSRLTGTAVDALAATQPAASKLSTALINATVEEPTPSGDWTMTPGEHGPTIAPRVLGKPAVEIADEDDAPINAIPAAPPTGDWMIALDPSQPDGWSEPSKIAKPPPEEQPGPPVSTVSSAKDLDSNSKLAPEPQGAVGPKVEIDPTLMEPLQPLQPIDDFDDEPGPAMPPPMPRPVPGSFVAPVPGTLASSSARVPSYPRDAAQLQMGQPRGVTDAGTGFFRDTNELVNYPTDSQPSIERPAEARKRWMIVAGISAAVVLLLVIVLVIVAGGGSKKTETEGSGSSGSAATNDVTSAAATIDGGSGQAPRHTTTAGTNQVTVTPPVDAAVEVPVTVDAAVASVAKTDCVVDVSSVPQGAEIVLGKEVIGTTPTQITLPCGIESRLILRKQRFVATSRAVTPKPEGQKPVRVALGKVMFTVKVSSSPPGANIYLGSKSLGITPTAIKVPAFETSTLKITKDGYAPDTQKITPKTNNLSITSSLKKAPKRVR